MMLKLRQKCQDSNKVFLGGLDEKHVSNGFKGNNKKFLFPYCILGMVTFSIKCPRQKLEGRALTSYCDPDRLTVLAANSQIYTIGPQRDVTRNSRRWLIVLPLHLI